MTGRTRAVAVAVVVAGLTGGVLAGGATAAGASPGGGLAWTECAGTDVPAGMECATLRVPVDWAKPTGRRITLDLARLPGTNPAARIGSVVVNPGGPGADGIDALKRSAARFTALRDRFDVVTWEPRGSWYTWGDALTQCAMTGPVFALPHTEAEYQARAEANRAAVEQCRGRDPELFDHLDSAAHARDLNAIRAAVGDRRLNFLANSYGGVIAASYARLFPDRVRTVVLDSIPDHVSTDRLPEEIDRYRDKEEVFARWIAWCQAATTCSLRGQDIPAVWQRLLADADAAPIPVGSTGVSYDGFDVQMAIGPFLSSAERWQQLSDALDEALRGDATGLSAPAAGMPGRKPVAPNAGLATSCADGMRGFASYADYQAEVHRGRELSPNFPGYQAAMRMPCVGYPGPVSNPPSPINPRGLPPLLGVADLPSLNATRNVADQVPGSVTIAIDGLEHGAYLNFGNPCVVAHANRYFVDRVLPPAGATCPTS
ncbi:alpha/beta fold hydrolase [Goodfellowiella coeruleoviolacea]|uniref:Pimeloyl-ACP methyl ester carboxylesterase n=1 Tax=Goodfellowiella coeruleoviolacea TaxID=334858 RepID=A0AAE3GMR5_9PSEU|nr:alpha/beta fold hydrolase [Goodfellowiella coeruleoviolacea]MCP2168838.1 Pimeloyl-ACP methyl ester carboxylesterase [Goodfellowiella coeruleoviolacea]